MICKSCGKQLPDDAKFCLECGMPVKVQMPTDGFVSRHTEEIRLGEKKQESETPQEEQEIFHAQAPEKHDWNLSEFPNKEIKKTDDVSFDWHVSDFEFRNRPDMSRHTEKEQIGKKDETKPELPAGFKKGLEEDYAIPKSVDPIEKEKEKRRGFFGDLFKSKKGENEEVKEQEQDKNKQEAPAEDEAIPEKEERRGSEISSGKREEAPANIEIEESKKPGDLETEATDAEEQKEEIAKDVSEPVIEKIIPEEADAQDGDITGERLEKELFKEMSEENMTEAERLRKRQTDKLDKFYTFNKKNEEFQRLLDQEYEKFKSEDVMGKELDDDMSKLGGFYEDHSGSMEESVQELIRKTTAAAEAQIASEKETAPEANEQRQEESVFPEGQEAEFVSHAKEKEQGYAESVSPATRVFEKPEKDKGATKSVGEELPAAESTAEPEKEPATQNTAKKEQAHLQEGVSAPSKMLKKEENTSEQESTAEVKSAPETESVPAPEHISDSEKPAPGEMVASLNELQREVSREDDEPVTLEDLRRDEARPVAKKAGGAATATTTITKLAAENMTQEKKDAWDTFFSEESISAKEMKRREKEAKRRKKEEEKAAKRARKKAKKEGRELPDEFSDKQEKVPGKTESAENAVEDGAKASTGAAEVEAEKAQGAAESENKPASRDEATGATKMTIATELDMMFADANIDRLTEEQREKNKKNVVDALTKTQNIIDAEAIKAGIKEDTEDASLADDEKERKAVSEENTAEGVEENADEAGEAKDEKGSKGNTIAIVILSIVLAALLALAGIRIFAPGSAVSNKMDDIASSVIGLFQGDDSSSKADTSEEDAQDLNGVIQEEYDKNTDGIIALIKYDKSLKYDSDTNYGSSDIKNSSEITDNNWYEEDGTQYYVRNGIIGAVIDHEVAVAQKLDGGYSFDELGIGELRKGENAYYAWIAETINNGEEETKTYKVLEVNLKDKKAEVSAEYEIEE